MSTDLVPVIDYLDSPPKRYEISVGGDRVIRWNETRDGAWVRFEDMDLYMFEGSQLMMQLAAENARLRDAIREIAGYEGVPEQLDYTAAEMRDIARAALDVSATTTEK